MMYLFKKEVSSGNKNSDRNRSSLSGFEERPFGTQGAAFGLEEHPPAADLMPQAKRSLSEALIERSDPQAKRSYITSWFISKI